MKKEVDENRKFFVERLGYFRNKSGLSARELSLRMGMSAGYIAKFEMYGINMPSEVLMEALNVLEVSPEQFFSKNPENYEDISEVIKLYNRISSENKQVIKCVMKGMK